MDAVTDKATGLADDLEATITAGASDIVKREDKDLNELTNKLELGSLTAEQHFSGLTDKLDITQLTSDITKRQDETIEDDVPAGDITGQLLGQEDLLSTVNSLLTDVTSTTTTLESTLTSLIHNLEGADVEGVLTDVEGLVDALLAKVQDVSDDADLGLDLSAFQPTLNTLSDKIGGLVGEVQSLLDVGVVSDLTGEITGVLADALRLVDNLLSLDGLVGSS